MWLHDLVVSKKKTILLILMFLKNILHVTVKITSKVSPAYLYIHAFIFKVHIQHMPKMKSDVNFPRKLIHN